MFGLMKVRTCSQPPEIKRHRRLHYCGTCKTMGRLYGQKSRVLLNHDTVFLAEVLSAVANTNSSLDEWQRAYQSYNCLALPDTDGEMPLPLQFAATATLILSEFKIADHITDSGRRRWRAAHRFFSKSFHSASSRLKQWNFPVDELRRCLLTQEAREARADAHAASPDATLKDLAEPTAIATAMFLQHGARLVDRAELAPTMYALGYEFGALIYLLDAFEDYEKDVRTANFNALRAAHGISDNRLPVEIRKQVIEYLWSIAAEIEASLNQLPMEASWKTLFISRLRSNLTHKLGARLPVIGHVCQIKTATKKSLHERWRDAVTLSRGLTEKRSMMHKRSRLAQLQSPFVFASVLPVALLFPQWATEANSYRECMSLGLNLMFIGSVAATLVAPLRFSTSAGPELAPEAEGEAKSGKGKKGTKSSGCGDSCCCCCEVECCESCECCGECCSCCD
jgi:hypothetical protein